MKHPCNIFVWVFFLCAFAKFIQFLLINLVLSVEKEKGIPFFLV
ncbi:hypothetical protein APS_1361 [Acetobacter pasteurianus subsp. pasteurianus LMG 1262 = NBRC 106471]|nr:hypothetical protein APS_1361 [Acetobacter pasteurianus subsp. pasteurianus LMG 1262 = NBRC 106471]